MHQRGVTLVETMVAMTVVAFGLLAMARVHLAMGQAADAARSRSEATQHARAMMEELRGRAFDALDGGSDLPGTPAHTAYVRRWAVEGHPGDSVRPVVVVVEWTDRRGDRQEVILRSSMARSDPSEGGAAVAAPAAADPWWRPNGRHHAVPPTAVSARGSDGRPMLPWPGGAGGALVFDAVTGVVVARCAAAPPAGDDAPSGCRQASAHLVQGYIEGRDAGRARVVVDLRDGDGGVPECVLTDVADPRSGRRVAGLRRYQCLVPARDDDGDAATPAVWSGELRLAGLPEDATVCRYATGADAAGHAHPPETYTRVDASLDHQNFVIAAGGVCPDGAVVLAST